MEGVRPRLDCSRRGRRAGTLQNLGRLREADYHVRRDVRKGGQAGVPVEATVARQRPFDIMFECR